MSSQAQERVWGWGGAEYRRVLGGSGVLGLCVSFFFQLRCSLTALLEA